MLKAILEQFTTQDNTILHDVKSLLSTTTYTFYNAEMQVYLTAVISTTFAYNSEQMLDLVHKDILTVLSVHCSNNSR